MFTSNPFAELSAHIPSGYMQTFVVIMLLLVIVGTLFDIWHKKSAKYFFQNWRKANTERSRTVSGGEMVSIALQTTAIDIAASGEFCSTRRRIAHLLTMYGFIFYVVATAIMVFKYPTTESMTPVILPQLWNIGAWMVCIGGYWFWFFIRVDVVAEGNSPFRLIRADLFVLALLSSTTLALIWAYLQSNGSAWTEVILGLYILTTTILFGSVPWSKFSHMFFKPAAAYQKRIETANGSRSNLPEPAEKPATLGSARRQPNHY